MLYRDALGNLYSYISQPGIVQIYYRFAVNHLHYKAHEYLSSWHFSAHSFSNEAVHHHHHYDNELYLWNNMDAKYQLNDLLFGKEEALM